MNIYEKIVEISNELRIAKDGNNEFKGFKYFKPDDIAQAINPLLKKHSIIIFFDMPFNKVKEMYEGRLIIANSGDEEIGKEGQVEYQFDIPLTSVAAASPAQNAEIGRAHV